jgi:hypothetical protein
MSAVSLVLKQRVAKILRNKVQEGLPQDLADLVRKDMFEVLDDEDFVGITSVLLAALIDNEVNNFVKE